MQLFIYNPKVNPNINYAGKTLPQDKAAPYVQPVDPNIQLNGKTLPADAIKPTPFKDTVNTPGYVSIGGVVLPPDTLITPIEAKKILVVTEILDGPPVFERITTKATKIEFEFTLRMYQQGGVNFNGVAGAPQNGPGPTNNVFAQEYLYQMWFRVFKPNSVLQVQNSMLNNLNISQLIVEEFHVAVVRGSTNIPCRLHCWENVVGQSLIIQTAPTP